MTIASVPSLHTDTPNLTVAEARGLPVRELQCYREAADDAVDLRITRHNHDPRGQLNQSVDPRLASTSPNFRWQHDLGGQPLRTDSVDAGVTLALTDVAGRALLAISATGVRQTSTYEDSTLPGRLQAVLEQAPGEAAPQVTDRFCWAGQSQMEKDLNLSGQCVRHYDTAGLNQLQRGGVSGAVLAQSRQLLAGEQAADWAGESEQGWQAALDAEAFITQRTVDATGAQVTQTDACGHVQRLAYDLTGQLRGSWLTLQGQAEQVIVASLRYSAMGQKLQEVHGNGVITAYDYEPRTQHLIGIRVQRPANAGSAARVLQDLRYTYDPVGNVLNVRNDAEATRFWRNQKVVPEQAFAYDSLYQLVRATGREMANRGQQGSQLPAALVPLPCNDDAYTPYTRTYRYDRAGNLTHLQHSAPASHNNYTTQLTVSHRSNRAVLAQNGLLPEDVDAQFDDGGHQLALLPGQHLRWNTRGELAQVTPILRKGQPEDREWYRYGSNVMRVLKVSQQTAAGTTHVQRVLYLEGLEVRSTRISDITSECLQVVAVAAGGGAAIRVLRWTSGLPPELKNDQIRYSYHNLIDSSGLELDAQGEVISLEEYYPYGGTSVWTARSRVEAGYKSVRYSGKERDAIGLYYYGYRFYQPWIGRWLSADPAGTADGLNLFRMVRNNPLTLHDPDGRNPVKVQRKGYIYAPLIKGNVIDLIAGENYVRQRNNKLLRPVIVPNDKMKNELQAEALKKAQLNQLLLTKGLNMKTNNSWQATGLTFEKFEMELEIRKWRGGILSSLEIISNESGQFLTKLSSGESKLLIVGHGGAGRHALRSGPGSNESISIIELGKSLLDGGLPKDYQDIRILACHSADAISPTDFSDLTLSEATSPIIDTTKLHLGMNWNHIEGTFSTAQALSKVMDQSGFSELGVKGYSGNEHVYSAERYHTRIIGKVGSESIRRSKVGHIHWKGL